MNICLNPEESHVAPDASPTPMMCPEPHCGYLVNGAIADGWRVNSLFARGPVSDLYLASPDDSRLAGAMVVKVLKWQPIGPPTRLMESLKPILALRHPHILPVQGVGWTGAGGKLYLIVPYAEFGSLVRYLQASATIPPLAAAGLVFQMASALQHAHQQRMIHGRLSLDNCLLVSPATVQISDFYHSLLEDLRTISPQGTSSPTSIPTWEHVEPATDQYGLAAITCQMLLGQAAFQDATQAVLAQHPEGGVTLIRSLRPDIPGQVGDVLLRALNPQPQRRYGNIMEFATNFQAALEQRAPSHPSGWPNRAEEAARDAASVRMSAPPPQARVYPAQPNVAPSPPPSGLQTACTLPGHTSPSTALRFAPNGMFLASGSVDRSLVVWRIVKRIGTPMGTLVGHTGEVLCLAWSPNSRLLASSGGDATIRLWEFTGPSGDQARTEAKAAWWAHEGSTTALDWSPSGAQIASGGSDRTIRLWALDGTAQSAWQAHGRNGVTALAWSPNGQLLASGGSDHIVNLWDVQTNSVALRFEASFDEVRRIAWSPDGTLLAFSGGKKDTGVSLWSLTSRRHIVTLSGHSREITGLFWGPQGNWLGTVSADATLRVWRTDSGLGEPFGRSISLPGTPLAAAASLDSGLVALGLDDMLVHVLEFTK